MPYPPPLGHMLLAGIARSITGDRKRAQRHMHSFLQGAAQEKPLQTETAALPFVSS